MKEDMDEADKSLLSAADINKTNTESLTPRQIKPNESEPHETHSVFVAFLIMVKRSFIYAWLFLTAISSVFVVTFIVFPGVSLHTSLKFMKGIEDDSLRGSW